MISRPVPQTATLDANEAVATVAFRLSELFAIYPITPSSPMGEWVDEWSAQQRTNLWNHVPEVIQMQSEGGAAGALHGALQASALASSFTASQGLLLMIPNLYKIAGELHPFVLHVTARSLATHALSIFCDHGDVMACRQTGVAMLCATSVQESQDFAAIAHAATLRTRVPFIHFFDGFRTSHEVQKIQLLSDDDLRALLPPGRIEAFRKQALTPDRPTIRGTAQNPDVFFQAREAANAYYDAVPAAVQELFDSFAVRTGRAYKLFDYEGHPEANRVVVIMGSGAETVAETAEWLNAQGERTGVLKVRLFRPLDPAALLAALPKSVRKIAVLDRTKEPGAVGEPLFLDVATTLFESGSDVKLIGGRYGLGSKEFTPAMAKAVFDHLATDAPLKRFTVGINDDITKLSLPYDAEFDLETDETRRAVFYGLGADGTVGANKNSIKIIGEGTDLHAQGFFVYDSKKSGAMTVSHLRFGPKPIRAPYLISRASFVAVHHFPFIERMEVLGQARPGGTLLINVATPADKVWDRFPREVQERVLELKLKVYAIDAFSVARDAGMGGQINTVMQTCFFALSGVLPRDEAIAAIKYAIKKTYGKKGDAVVAKNEAAVDAALAAMHEVVMPGAVTAKLARPPVVAQSAPDFVQRVTAMMLANKGDDLPVSVFPPDGTWPVATTKWEKRSIALEIPTWDPSLCIQCNKCVLVCPHAAIRCAAFPEDAVANAPETFQSVKLRSNDVPNHLYTIQVAPEDCTGCTLCHKVCPARDKSDLKRKALMMVPIEPLIEKERANFDFFLNLPPAPAALLQDTVKGSQFREPLFEFSGACTGCGETPYLKLLTQLYGDRLLIANATGCSSIYGGNLPTTPYTANREGRGPAWSNSLFEDNAEYGLGIRAGVDQLAVQSLQLLHELAPQLPADVVAGIDTPQVGDAAIATARAQVAVLKTLLPSLTSDERAQRLLELADYLVKKSVWIVGGDGWAYDIGFGGLDHVLASGRKVNILVLDTEVYSNTGGQRSKSTPLGAVAKFSAAGKDTDKKDLAMMAASYGHVYVARVAFGAKDSQTVQAFVEAEAHPGPSLIIAYSHCIAHGYSLANGLDQQKLAVDSGHWPLFRHDPTRKEKNLPITTLDSPPPKVKLKDYTRNELRYQVLYKTNPERAAALGELGQKAVDKRVANYQQLAANGQPPKPPAPPTPPADGAAPATETKPTL
ncbi:MAG: pyruvate:ferredoxin (flavodoxin) oxidoreductase [Candidatus Didemnitutus sp.]|nr:pyruvate:ferredoxin (flavodoxin) oxidoreductase [Candidatus Didemnitutus sp.]